jgi:phosphate transport system protein
MLDIEYEIKIIKDSILEMTALVETSIKDAVESLVNNDADLGRLVIRSDHLINSYCLSIEEDCLKLISSNKPKGKDLRFITTAIKLVFVLEHIADNAVKIAERDLDLDWGLKGYPHYVIEPQIRNDFLKISETALSILRDTVESFVKEQMIKDVNVLTCDENLDKLHDNFIDKLMVEMVKSSDPIYCAARMSYVARYLEKIGEHAIKLSEMVADMLDGRLINNYLTAEII